MKLNDAQLYALLANLLNGEGTAQIQPRNSQAEEFSIKVLVEILDNHRGDSPDVVLWLNLEIIHPRLPPMKFRIPVPI